VGWARITNNLGLGRYRIKIDSGESTRIALLNATNSALALVGSKITASYEQVVLADAMEAEARENIQAAIDILVLENDPVANKLAQDVLNKLQIQYAKTVSANQPVRQQYQTLKNKQADLLKQRSKWESLQTITYKDAWCTDYTINKSINSVVATIDIPGDTNLTLIAPGGRSFRYGDGTISSDRKAAQLSKRSIELISAGSKLAEIDAAIKKATDEETVLKTEIKYAQDTYIATPTPENGAAFEKKTLELAEKRHEIANLTLNKQYVTVTINRLNQEIAYWSGRPSKDVPDPGDGGFLERELTSPAQAYFNAAIFPAWQKWMPTYRWGTASNVNETANTMDVELGSATSSAQGLNVNQSSNLKSVTVQYMTCNAGAFEDGDRVIVQFSNQLFDSPVVIGFLENPRQCIAWPTSIIMDLWYETEVGLSQGTRYWANIRFGINSCSGTYERLTFDSYSLRPIAPAATHFIRLQEPVFSDSDISAGANNNFDINVVDGNFSVLWSGNSSAYTFDTANGASAKCPGSVALSNSFISVLTGLSYVSLIEYSTSAYTQGTAHGYENNQPGDGFCYLEDEQASGAWIHPGNVNIGTEPIPITSTSYFDSPVEEFLNSQGAMPTAITVTRKKGGKTPKTYTLFGTSETQFESGQRHRWRLEFRIPT
jgi:hypothetical protein